VAGVNVSKTVRLARGSSYGNLASLLTTSPAEQNVVIPPTFSESATTKMELESSAGITTPGRGKISSLEDTLKKGPFVEDGKSGVETRPAAGGITTPGGCGETSSTEDQTRTLKQDGVWMRSSTTKMEQGKSNVSETVEVHNKEEEAASSQLDQLFVDSRSAQSNTRTTGDPSWQHAFSANEGKSLIRVFLLTH